MNDTVKSGSEVRGGALVSEVDHVVVSKVEFELVDARNGLRRSETMRSEAKRSETCLKLIVRKQYGRMKRREAKRSETCLKLIERKQYGRMKTSGGEVELNVRVVTIETNGLELQWSRKAYNN